MNRFAARLLDPQHQRQWRLLLAALVALVSWFAFSEASGAAAFSQVDKVKHVLAFTGLATAAALGWGPGLRTATFAATGLALYGAFIEAVQSFLPGRVASWHDLLADGLGIACGLLLVWLARRQATGQRS